MKSIKSIHKSPLFILFWVVATELIGFGLIIPVLPQIATRFSASGMWIAILLASYSLMQFFAAPILGSYSDRFGRKPILVLSKLGSMLGYILFALAGSFWMLLLARIVDGISGGNISVARAYVADVTTPENRSKGMAVIGIAFATGFILGPALGGLLYGNGGGLLIPGLVAAGLSGIATLLTILFLPETQNRVRSESVFSKLSHIPSVFSDFNTSAILLVQLAYMIVFSGFETSIAVFMFYNFDFSEQQNSMVFLYIGLLALIFQGYLTRKKIRSYVPAIQIGFGLAATSLLMLAFNSGIYMVFIGLAILSLGVCLINVCLPAYFSAIVSSEQRGMAMGVFESIGSISRVIGPLIVFLFLFSHLRFGYLIFSLVFISAIAFLIYKQRRSAQQI